MSDLMLTIPDAAGKFNITENNLYKTLTRCRQKNNPILEIQGKRFFIYKGTARLYLVPTELPDIDAIESKTVLDTLDDLIPYLCADCRDAVIRGRSDFIRRIIAAGKTLPPGVEITAPLPATPEPSPAGRSTPEAVPTTPAALDSIITTHTI